MVLRLPRHLNRFEAGPSARECVAAAADEYAASIILSDSARKQVLSYQLIETCPQVGDCVVSQVEAAEQMSAQALLRIKNIRETTQEVQMHVPV